MNKKTRNRILISSSLILLLIGSKIKIDKSINALNGRILDYGKTSLEDNVNLVAHRGYSNMFADNTMESIKACEDLKCIKGIECDVRLTKDNKIVLMHDDYIGFRPISDYTYDELCSINLKDHIAARPTLFNGYNLMEHQLLIKRYSELKSKPYTLCTLEDVLRERDKSKTLFIDIKFSGYNDDYLLAKIGELIKSQNNIIVQSFNETKLRLMAELYPEHKYQLLVDSKRQLDNIDYLFDAYGIKYSILEDDTIEDLREHEKIVSLWTVDNYKDFSKLVEENEEYNDSIYYITNNPDILSFQLKNSFR